MNSSNITIELDGRACLASADARRPNVFRCPLGESPGGASLLLTRRDVDALAADAAAEHTLVFRRKSDDGSFREEVAFPRLLFIQAERVDPGAKDDPDALFQVELADRRWLAEQYSDVGKLRLNLRSFAQDDAYLDGTGGADWAAVIEELWSTLAGMLGDFPGLPATFSGAGGPDNVDVTGQSAWRLLHRLLEEMGCSVRYEPLTAAFFIVDLAADQADLSGNLSQAAKYFDEETIRPAAGPVAAPETIRVYFRNWPQSYGQERDTGVTDHWLVDGRFHSLDVATNIAGAASGTVLPLWDERTRNLDEDGQPINAAEVTARAQQRAAAWLGERSRRSQSPQMTLPGWRTDILPGAAIAEVRWQADARHGATTELRRHSERPPSYSRHGSPQPLAADFRPHVSNVVQVVHSGVAAGEAVAANADGLHGGRVRRWVAGAMETLEDCWIRFIDDHDTDAGAVAAVNHELYGPGRLCGVETSEGVTRPLYLARRGFSENVFLVGAYVPYQQQTTTVIWSQPTRYEDGVKLELGSGGDAILFWNDSTQSLETSRGGSVLQQSSTALRFNRSLILDAQANDANVTTEFGVRTQALFIDAGDYTGYGFFLERDNGANPANAPIYSFGRKGGAGAAIASGDLVGRNIAWGWDGSKYTLSATMDYEVDGAVSSGAVPVAFVIRTGSKSATVAERLRVDSSGAIFSRGRHKFDGGTQSSAGNNGITKNIIIDDPSGGWHDLDFEDGLLVAHSYNPGK